MKDLTYAAVVKELKIHKNPIHLTKKELKIILEDQKNETIEETKKTRIYQKYGGEYCSLLQVLHQLGGGN
ncbi:hypothetical protein [Enterococcus sp. AZ196]|uniref:hypothetical protein n=1 Tax=Enterococcus sp. AZ196 TaxID=2774659 RepID=UPI003D2C433F